MVTRFTVLELAPRTAPRRRKAFFLCVFCVESAACLRGDSVGDSRGPLRRTKCFDVIEGFFFVVSAMVLGWKTDCDEIYGTPTDGIACVIIGVRFDAVFWEIIMVECASWGKVLNDVGIIWDGEWVWPVYVNLLHASITDDLVEWKGYLPDGFFHVYFSCQRSSTLGCTICI